MYCTLMDLQRLRLDDGKKRLKTADLWPTAFCKSLDYLLQSRFSLLAKLAGAYNVVVCPDGPAVSSGLSAAAAAAAATSPRGSYRSNRIPTVLVRPASNIPTDAGLDLQISAVLQWNIIFLSGPSSERSAIKHERRASLHRHLSVLVDAIFLLLPVALKHLVKCT